jgi:predicted regulator of amino acid metabolism with ACT domain
MLLVTIKEDKVEKQHITKIVEVAKSFGFKIIAVDEKVGAFYCALACDSNLISKYGNDKIIIINDNESYRKKRFLIAIAIAFYKIYACKGKIIIFN